MVVARVGSEVVTAADLERRLRALPPYSLKDYGSSPREIRKNFLDRVMVREIVLTLGAIDAGFEKHPEISDRTRSILRTSVIDQVKEQVLAEPVTDEAVRAYYDANKDKFVAPKRIAVWRILVGSEAEAREIIGEMKQGATLDVKKWGQLARDKSLDKMTAMKSGNIGFLNPDGTTAQPELKYDPGIYDRADKVQDGELVDEPVKEGEQWAVVWRKQAMKAVSRSIELESSTIRSAILDEKVRKLMNDLLSKLRSEHVPEVHPELVDTLTVSDTGEVERVSRPGVLPRPKRVVETTPIETPIGPR
ncbi:MAG: peptidyl-prolyl cis-trans isomerase [Polyangiaceae bacterium]